MSGKLVSLSEAAALVRDGQMVAFGGSLLHRSPSALTRELARQRRRALTFVKPSAGYDVDLLCAAGCLETVYAGIIVMDAGFGLAPSYRQAVERGDVKAVEHAWISLVAGLRAAAMGIPFQPVAGMLGSDIPAASGLKTVSDPYTGQDVCVVGQIRPDWAIVHVPEADEDGNARIYGTPFWDRIISRAARGVIISTERVVSRAYLAEQPELTAIPALFVKAVVEAPGGALPCSSTPDYDVDLDGVAAYLRAATTPDSLHAYLEAQDRELRGRPPHRAA